MNKILKTFIFTFSALLFLSAAAFAQKGETVEKRIKFTRGKSSATVKGFIADRLTSNLYLVSARRGQTLTVIFNSPRKDVDVCLLFPDKRDYCGRRKYSVHADGFGQIKFFLTNFQDAQVCVFRT